MRLTQKILLINKEQKTKSVFKKKLIVSGCLTALTYSEKVPLIDSAPL